MKNKKLAIATLAFLAVTLSLTISVLGQTTTPNVFVDPVIHNASSTGEIFTVKVNVTDASGLAGYGVNMRFDPAILVATGWNSGGFLESTGIGTVGLTVGNHSDVGTISLGDTLSGQGSVSGNGTLVKITFTTRGGGRCALALYDTTLLDEANEEISHTDTNGQFIYNYLSLTPSNGTAAFMIQGFGFGTNAMITAVTWNDTTLPVMSTQCDARGNFVTPGIFPDISTPGNYTIKVLDSGGNSKEAVFTLTAATGLKGDKGDKGDTGPQGPAGTSGADAYIWAALILSILAIIVGIYAATRKKN